VNDFFPDPNSNHIKSEEEKEEKKKKRRRKDEGLMKRSRRWCR